MFIYFAIMCYGFCFSSYLKYYLNYQLNDINARERLFSNQLLNTVRARMGLPKEANSQCRTYHIRKPSEAHQFLSSCSLDKASAILNTSVLHSFFGQVQHEA